MCFSDKLIIKVFHQANEHAPFIIAVNGLCTIGVMEQIEDQLEGEPPEESGEYVYHAQWEPPQIGEFGRIELPGYWCLTQIEFVHIS